MERRIKGKGRPDIKRGILPGPQRRQPAGAEGTPERGCPSGGGRGRNAQGPASPAPPMDLFGSWAWSPSYPQGGVRVAFGSCCRGMWLFGRWVWESSGVSHTGAWLSTCSLGDAAGPPRAVGLSFLLPWNRTPPAAPAWWCGAKGPRQGQFMNPPFSTCPCLCRISQCRKQKDFVQRTIPSLGRDDHTTLCLFNSSQGPRGSVRN